MKVLRLICIAVVACALYTTAFSQDADAKWTRLQTDNGEFSIEVPEGFSYVFDAEGFIASVGPKDYRLRDVNIVSGFVDHTLVSFEVYRGSGDALGPLIETSQSQGDTKSKSTVNGIPTRSLQKNGAEFDFVSHYFKSKEFIYVLTGLSRTKDSPIVKRFFDSLRFNPGSVAPATDGVRLSTVKVSPIKIVTQDVTPVGSPNTAATPSPKPDPDYKPVIIASRPRASYVDRARSRNVEGVVKLRIDFAENAFTPRIEVLTGLPEGLFRQALFAALRLKFVPAERNARAVAVRKVVEYSFDIY